MSELFDRIKLHFWPTKNEWKDFLMACLVLGFIFSFNQWGTEQFDVLTGLKNWLIAFLIALISVGIHNTAQRVLGLKMGYKSEHKLWWPGLIAGIVIAAITEGQFKFLAGTYLMLETVPLYRLGLQRKEIRVDALGWISFTGCLANLLLGAIGYGLGGEALGKLVSFNLWFALFNMLPFPPLDGSRVFYASRMLYAFLAGTFLAYTLLAVFSQVHSIALSAIIGAGISLLFYFFFERHWIG